MMARDLFVWKSSKNHKFHATPLDELGVRDQLIRTIPSRTNLPFTIAFTTRQFFEALRYNRREDALNSKDNFPNRKIRSNVRLSFAFKESMLAYASDESGDFEVYVRPFRGPSGKWRISTAGGLLPVWSKSGHELAYETRDGRVMMVSYAVRSDTFTSGQPRLWSDQRVVTGEGDLAPDGKRFVVLLAQPSRGEQRSPDGINLLLNFFDYLKQRAPVGGK